ncbi:DnaJ-domain-containing protein [Meredithblackwellia eburnea MCA 4105]
MPLLDYANSARSYAFSAATAYVFRSDASTSSAGAQSSTSTSSSRVSKSTHRRAPSSLPSASSSSSSNSSSPASSTSTSPTSAPPTDDEDDDEREDHFFEPEDTLPTSTGTRRSTPTGTTSNNTLGGTSSKPSNRTKAKKSRHSPNGRRSASPSSNNPGGGASGSTPAAASQGGGSSSSGKSEGEEMCDTINEEEDLYRILGVPRKSKVEEIRRAFLSRSRVCHPDKLPHYPPATPAFQRLSYAYETLSKPSSRRMYDLGGMRGYEPRTPRDTSHTGDETLNGVLRNVFTEFINGDFEMIRVFVNALNDGNPGLNLGDEAVDNLEGAFRRVREIVLSGQKYLRLIKFELIRLYEIQHSLRALSYFDFSGRLRLTLALTRVTLEIPMVLDRAMREEPISGPPPAPLTGQDRARMADAAQDDDDEGFRTGAGELQRRGLLGPRIKGVLVLACKVLEKGERYGQ